LKTDTYLSSFLAGNEMRYSTLPIAQFLYIAFAFLVVILLSNVLIAIVTDSYGVIKNERSAMVFWANRLDFVAEMDASKSSSNYCRFIASLKSSQSPFSLQSKTSVSVSGHAVARKEVVHPEHPRMSKRHRMENQFPLRPKKKKGLENSERGGKVS